MDMQYALDQSSSFIIAVPPDRAFRIIANAVDLSLYIENAVTCSRTTEILESAFPSLPSLPRPPRQSLAYPLEAADKAVLSVGLRNPSLIKAVGKRAFHAVVTSLNPSPTPSVAFLAFRDGIGSFGLGEEYDTGSVEGMDITVPVTSMSSFSFTPVFLRIIPPSGMMFVAHDNPDLSSYRIL